MTSIFLGFNLKIAGILVGNYQPPLHIYDYHGRRSIFRWRDRTIHEFALYTRKSRSQAVKYLEHPLRRKFDLFDFHLSP